MAFPANVEVDDITGEITKELEDPDLLQNRPPFQRALVISGNYSTLPPLSLPYPTVLYPTIFPLVSALSYHKLLCPVII